MKKIPGPVAAAQYSARLTDAKAAVIIDPPVEKGAQLAEIKDGKVIIGEKKVSR